MSSDIENCPKCGAKVYHFWTYIGDIDYALCSRNSSVKVKPDGSVVNQPFVDKDDPNYFHCWGLDY